MMPASPSFSPEPPKNPEQLCAQRSQRIMDAVLLKQPDRIPIMIRLGYLLAEIGGMTRLDMHQDPERAQAALVKAAFVSSPTTSQDRLAHPTPAARWAIAQPSGPATD